MGDAWAAYYAFELQQGTEVEQTDVLDRYVSCVMSTVTSYLIIQICIYGEYFHKYWLMPGMCLGSCVFKGLCFGSCILCV